VIRGAAPGVPNVLERLSRVIGRTVIGVRVGPGGFDLVFDDGTELEAYFLDTGGEGTRCVWSVVVARYRLYRMPSTRVAEEIAYELNRHLVEATIVGPTEEGNVYIGVNEDHLEELKQICPRLSAVARKYLCQQQPPEHQREDKRPSSPGHST